MEISTFNNEEFGEIRTIQENGEVLFCGADIAKALGYSNTRDALSRHCKGVVKCDTPTNGGIQSLGFISEGNVYRLIAHSKLPGAERFEKWVFDEVLPSIRKNGAYMTEDVLEQALASPDFLIELATRLKTEKAKNAQLTVSNQIMQPKADYFDMLVDRNLLTGIRDTAKELGVRQNDFVRFLLDKGYLYRSKKGWRVWLVQNALFCAYIRLEFDVFICKPHQDGRTEPTAVYSAVLSAFNRQSAFLRLCA